MNLTNILVGLLVVALIAAFGGFTQFAERFSTTIEHELAARWVSPQRQFMAEEGH